MTDPSAARADENRPLELRSRIPNHCHGMPLADYLAQRFPYLSRTDWVDQLTAGRLSLDGQPARPDGTARGGAQLAWRKMQREPEVDRRITIVHADEQLVVIDKPAHLPMHSDGPFVTNTLIHIARERLDALSLRLVHRLDRETSGLCVLARTEAVRRALADQFAHGTVTKTYAALVHGVVDRDFAVDLPIGHAAASAIDLRRSAAPDAREPRAARTSFTVLGRAADRTLLRCVPTTGRTHQIRVHLEAVGHPVLGDKLYGRPDADYLAFVQRVKAGALPSAVPAHEPGRHLLHAAGLAFVHPGTARAVAFRADLPADFTPWLAGISPAI